MSYSLNSHLWVACLRKSSVKPSLLFCQEQFQDVPGKTTKPGEGPAKAGNPEATRWAALWLSAWPKHPDREAATHLLTYMTVINILRPVASTSGLPWLWGTQKSDCKSTKRFQDRLSRLKAHPLSQEKHLLSRAMIPLPHTICPLCTKRTSPLKAKQCWAKKTIHEATAKGGREEGRNTKRQISLWVFHPAECV